MKRLFCATLMAAAPLAAQTADPHADPHAGHDMATMAPAAVTDPHAGHDMATMAPAAPPANSPANPPANPPPAAAFAGPAWAADGIFGADAMRPSRKGLRAEHGDIRTAILRVKRAEAWLHDGANGYALEAGFSTGGDLNRAMVRTRLHGTFGGDADAALEGGWRHALDPWFNLLAGVRHDVGPGPGPDRTHAMVAINGLAPYLFEVEGAFYLSTRGELTARFEADIDQRLTQKLIVQPAIELALSAQDMPDIHTGAGLTSADAGLRLRYEFVPEFAPYIGVMHQRLFGGTARYARSRGDETAGWRLLLGLITWF